MMWVPKVVSILCLLGIVHSYRIFQNSVPNGDNVPNPCKPDYIWTGLGHLMALGGGMRNSFGKDFLANKMIWDECLCSLDSDGDGKTNGEELGDPDCRWTPGSVPALTTGLSHPGICEPIDSEDCRLRNHEFSNMCYGGEPVNPCIEDIKNQYGMLSKKISVTPVEVPAALTTHMCQIVDGVGDGVTPYHAVAAEPAIETDLIHHILLYGCTEHPDLKAMEKALPCNQVSRPPTCNEGLFVYTTSMNGDCYNENFGLRMGEGGFTHIHIQVHFDNPELIPGVVDGSGLTVYFTPNLRPYTGSYISTGQRYLAIPPQKEDVTYEATCPAECTRRPSNLPHTRLYTYALHRFDPPIEFLPGDELQTFCHFQTMSKSEPVYYGQNSFDEMCFADVFYYPRNIEAGIAYCEMTGTWSKCQGTEVVDGCNRTHFREREDQVFEEIGKFCDPTGKTCLPGCRDILAGFAQNDTCMRGDAFIYMKTSYIVRKDRNEINYKRFSYLVSCDEEKKPNELEKFRSSPLCPDPNGSAQNLLTKRLLSLSVVLAAGFMSLLI